MPGRVHRCICKGGKKNRKTNDEKVGEQAEKARHTIENEKQDLFQFVSA